MQTKPIFNLRTNKQSAIAIFGDYSRSAVYVSLDQLERKFGGDIELAFHSIKKMQNENLLPRMGSESRPLTARDFELYKRNVRLGNRYWQWIQDQGQHVRQSTGYDSVWGYGYKTDSGFVIVDKEDSPHFVVEVK